MNTLDETTNKIIEKIISEVVGEYTEDTKVFTADTLHYLRSKITSKVKEVIGDDVINFIDVGLDLRKLENIDFFFKVNIPNKEEEKTNAIV